MQKLLKLSEKLPKYLTAALLVFIPLFPKFPFINIPGTYVSIRLEDFLLAVAAFYTLLYFIPRLKSLAKNNVFRSVAIYLLIGLISLFSGIVVTKTVVPSIGILHFMRRVEYFVPFFFAFTFLPESVGKNIGYFTRVMALVVILLFVYGFGQRYFNFPVIITQNAEYSKGVALSWMPGSHINSTFAGHYDMASYLVLVLPIFISLHFILKDKVSKIITAAVSLSAFWLLVNSLSRISLVSYLVAAAVALFLIGKKRAIIIVSILSIVLGAFSPSLFARYKRVFDVLYLKVLSKIEVSAQSPDASPPPVFEDRSSSIRFNVEWPRAVRALYKNPLLGTGYSSISLATDNDYLRLLGETGFLGFASFCLILVNLAIIFAGATPLYQKYTALESGFLAGVAGGAVGTLINAVFIDVFEASKFAITFWLLIGISVFVIKNKQYEQKI